MILKILIPVTLVIWYCCFINGGQSFILDKIKKSNVTLDQVKNSTSENKNGSSSSSLVTSELSPLKSLLDSNGWIDTASGNGVELGVKMKEKKSYLGSKLNRVKREKKKGKKGGKPRKGKRRKKGKKGMKRRKKGKKGKKGMKGKKGRKGKKGKRGKKKRKKGRKGKKKRRKGKKKGRKGKKKGQKGKKKGRKGKKKGKGKKPEKEKTKIKEKKVAEQAAGNKPPLKKIYPVKVDLETIVPVNKDKLKQIEQIHKIQKVNSKLLKKLDPCERRPCRHNGICKKTGKTPKDYQCVCPEGRKGKHCQISAARKFFKTARTEVGDDGGDKETLIILIGVGLAVAILIVLIVIIHCIRVKSKRSKLIAKYKQEKELGLDPPKPPSTLAVSNQLCCCGPSKPKKKKDKKEKKEKKDKKSKKGKKGKEGEEAEEEAEEGAEGEATEEQIDKLAGKVAEAKLSSEQVEQLTELVEKVSKSQVEEAE